MVSIFDPKVHMKKGLSLSLFLGSFFPELYECLPFSIEGERSFSKFLCRCWAASPSDY